MESVQGTSGLLLDKFQSQSLQVADLRSGIRPIVPFSTWRPRGLVLRTSWEVLGEGNTEKVVFLFFWE